MQIEHLVNPDAQAYPFALSAAARSALQAAAAMPAAEPVAAVEYSSAGRLLIIGPLPQAQAWGRLLREELSIEILQPGPQAPTLPGAIPVHSGELLSLHGWLGAFDVQWQDGAARYDLVLDLTNKPLFTMHQPPQGYFHVGEDAMSAAFAAKELVQAVGEFEKPKYFSYDEKLCAHSRNQQQGCNRCIDICSTRAISSLGDKVGVEPHLCMGCGACASVCPSGAMRYNYPSVAYLGEKLKRMLAAYRLAAADRPTLLLHSEAARADWLESGIGSKAAVDLLPLAVFQIASVGLDVLLYAIASGAARVVVVADAGLAPQYAEALQAQMDLAQNILTGLGYSGQHFVLTEAVNLAHTLEQVGQQPVGPLPQELAAFNPFNEKRTTLEFCINYFVKHSYAALAEALPLPEGAPFGNVLVDKSTCTLCMSCVSACPAAALRDTPGLPRLRFVERNCVQCGLCEVTCPEKAIRLVPRLLLTAEATEPRLLNEDVPFRCVRCHKVFASKRLIDTMTVKLSGHSMFATKEAQARLQMCADCRVIDMMDKP